MKIVNIPIHENIPFFWQTPNLLFFTTILVQPDRTPTRGSLKRCHLYACQAGSQARDNYQVCSRWNEVLERGGHVHMNRMER